MKATQLLKQQHQQVRQLFKQLKKIDDGAERRELMDEIAERLNAHMMIEEELFYPAVREGAGAKKVREEMVPEAYEEHHVVKLVIQELPDLDPDDERFQAKMTVLEELIEHHVSEEEKEMFKAAEKLGDRRLKDLGEEMESRASTAGSAEDFEAVDAPAGRTGRRS